jgi:hypothetical protein
MTGQRATAPVHAKPTASLPDKVTPAKHRLARQPQPRLTASREAQQRASAILEVLAGIRTPTDAAAALGIAPPRYYLLEQRALTGLVAACESRPVGPGRNLQRQIAMLHKEISRLKQDCTRQQALVRASQRTIGLAPPQVLSKPTVKAAGKSNGKKPRKRRPTVRALKALAAVQMAVLPVDEPDSSGVAPLGVLQQRPDSQPCVPAASSSPTAATGVIGE